MKLLKKILILILSQFCFLNISFKEVSALFGNTHFNIGKNIVKITKEKGIKIFENEEIYFLSGMVYADIGRFNFDKKCIASDSKEFAAKMENHAETSEEVWFIKGFKMHVLQDENTSQILKNIFGENKGGYKEYLNRCTLLDNYFKNKNKSFIFNDWLDLFDVKQVSGAIGIEFGKGKIPEDEINQAANSLLVKNYENIDKENLVLCEDLLIKTYRELGLEVDAPAILKEAANVVGAFALSSAINSGQELTEELEEKIEEEYERITMICIENLVA